jgi:hypothetical protein
MQMRRTSLQTSMTNPGRLFPLKPRFRSPVVPLLFPFASTVFKRMISTARLLAGIAGEAREQFGRPRGRQSRRSPGASYRTRGRKTAEKISLVFSLSFLPRFEFLTCLVSQLGMSKLSEVDREEAYATSCLVCAIATSGSKCSRRSAFEACNRSDQRELANHDVQVLCNRYQLWLLAFQCYIVEQSFPKLSWVLAYLSVIPIPKST